MRLLILLALALSSCAHHDPFTAQAEIVETAPTYQGGPLGFGAKAREIALWTPTDAEVVLWAEIRDLRIDLAECRGMR